MTDSPRTQLERAYRLIQQDHLDEAIALLNPFVAKNPDNADAWWLLANAVSEPSEARRALDNVLRINPGNMQARDLLEKLEQEFPNYAPVGSFTDDSGLDDMFGQKSNDPFDTDRMPSFVNEGPKSSPRNFVDDPAAKAGRRSQATGSTRRSPLLPVLLALLLIVVIGGAIAFFVTRQPVLAPSSSPTSVAAVSSPAANSTAAVGATTEATSMATATATLLATTSAMTNATAPATEAVSVMATESATLTGQATAEATETIAATAEATLSATEAVSLDDSIKAVTETFRAGGSADAEARLDTSALGKTLFVRLCSKAGPDLAKAVNSARELLAAQGVPLKDQVQAIGVEIVNCTNASQSLYKGVASIQDAVAFVDKTIDAKKFRASWKTG